MCVPGGVSSLWVLSHFKYFPHFYGKTCFDQYQADQSQTFWKPHPESSLGNSSSSLRMRRREGRGGGASGFCVEFTGGQWAMSWWKGVNTFYLTREVPSSKCFLPTLLPAPFCSQVPNNFQLVLPIALHVNWVINCTALFTSAGLIQHTCTSTEVALIGSEHPQRSGN